MRVAIINKYNSLVGGIESYLSRLVREFTARGHVVSLVYEHSGAQTRELIATENALTIERLDDLQVLRVLTAWNPDVVFVNSFSREKLMSLIAKQLLVVFFVHDYVGTCISGEKRHKFPKVQPCTRRFGPGCLFLYFPRRCGGWSPVTMWRQHRKQRKNLSVVRSAASIITASEAMRAEYIKHGFDPSLVHRLACPTKEQGGKRILPLLPWRLLFMGRMEPIKGGDVLLDAVTQAAELTGRKLRLVMVGDGRSRADWQARAFKLRLKSDLVEIHFTGWLEGNEVDRVLSQTDLLVIPSTWPEPHGLVGLEVGAWEIPSVAFDVGGISEWLRNGRNGVLSNGSPPTRIGLANSIAACLSSTEAYKALCKGALAASSRQQSGPHVDRLLEIFESVILSRWRSNAN